MPKTKAPSSGTRSEEAILDQATAGLLAAVKAKLTKEGKPLDREKLQKDGYSERFLQKLDEA